jgi:hypothetical protein
MHTRIALAILAALAAAEPAAAQFPDTFIPPPTPNLVGEPPATAQPPAEPTLGEPATVPTGGGTNWWVSSDFVFGWIRGTNLPALVTTSPSGTPQASAGVLGSSNNTTVLFGQLDAGDGLRPGVRIGAGAWLDPEHTIGVDASFFGLGSQNTLFAASSPDGSSILARPFSNAATGVNDAQLVSFPGLLGGSVSASLRTDNFYSGSFDFTEIMLNSGGFHLECLVGYRLLRFDERLEIDQSTVSLDTSSAIAVGTTLKATDRFTASNVMNGGEAGFRFGFAGENWSIDATGKCAVGMIHTSVGIEGSTQIASPGSPAASYPGGVFALGSNVGVYDHYAWEIAPEADITLGWDYNAHVHFQVGYSFLYWTDVARAANQINPNINPNLLPPAVPGATPVEPTFSLIKSDLWINMINVGVEFRF